MSAVVIDGSRLAEELRRDVERRVAELGASGVVPGLATVLVGEDYAARAYERRVRRLAEELGCRYVSEQLAADVEEALGLARGATVVSCHRFTAQAGRLEEHTSRADILVVAAGVPELVTGAMVKEGVIAVDVGINPVEDEQTGKVRLVGDLDFESVAQRAEALTCVPGGVGPITDVWLLRNAAEAALRAANGRR